MLLRPADPPGPLRPAGRHPEGQSGDASSSDGSLAELAGQSGVGTVDGRRFRMLIELDGGDGSRGGHLDRPTDRSVAPSSMITKPDARCADHDPGSRHAAHRDLDTLRTIIAYRGLRDGQHADFGVYGEVVQPGRIERRGSGQHRGERLRDESPGSAAAPCGHAVHSGLTAGASDCAVSEFLGIERTGPGGVVARVTLTRPDATTRSTPRSSPSCGRPSPRWPARTPTEPAGGRPGRRRPVVLRRRRHRLDARSDDPRHRRQRAGRDGDGRHVRGDRHLPRAGDRPRPRRGARWRDGPVRGQPTS